MLKGLVKMSCGENPPGAGDGRVFKPRSAKTSCEAFLQAGITGVAGIVLNELTLFRLISVAQSP